MINRRALVAVLLAVFAVAGSVASLAFGAVSIPIGDVVRILTGGIESGADYEIIQRLRLPRMVEALLVGAALGVAGACLQAALANPLASPDVIGVTGGAGFGAMLVILLLPTQAALVPLSALAFGLLAASLVFLIGFVGERAGGIGRVILAGIAIASLFGAATAALMAAFPDRVPAGIFFLVGGLTTTGWNTLEQKATSLPFIGPKIAAARGQSLDDFATAAEIERREWMHAVAHCHRAFGPNTGPEYNADGLLVCVGRRREARRTCRRVYRARAARGDARAFPPL